jgi:hypothetical protein
MHALGGNPKRQRIESLVKQSIDDAVQGGIAAADAGTLVSGMVRNFTDAWHSKYFDTADDRKVAGLVLAHMLESCELEPGEVNDQGYALLKLIAETEPEDFEKNTPRTFEQLKRKKLLGPGAGKLRGV